ncbi:MAG: hypothetical protein K0Q90_4696, partial [Paenibacillaceae bacterium]|nr:hypothetical protein [Paenibacillaceae bacterium]
HFHGTRDYFECHELLEEHWKEEQDPRLKEVWHGLIQVAVSLYHERRGNLPGARKMLEQAILHLTNVSPEIAGLDPVKLLKLLRTRYASLMQLSGQPAEIGFEDIALPFADGGLLREAMDLCKAWGCEWGRLSPLNEDMLVHRHLLRDRTDVVAERARQLAIRRQSQQGLTEREGI